MGGHDLRRDETYPEGLTASLDRGHARQDLASDRWQAIHVIRVEAPNIPLFALTDSGFQNRSRS